MALELLTLGYLFLEMDGDKPDLSPEERKRRDRRIPRLSIKRYSESAFLYLFQSGDDQALLNCCGVDHTTFRELLRMFKPVYDKKTMDDKTNTIVDKTFSPYGIPKGRPRELDATGALGLVLFWYRSRGSVARTMSLAFGLTSTPMYKWLKFSRKVLLSALQHHPDAKVLPPSDLEVETYAAAISNKYPILGPKKVWAAVDGLKLHLEQATDYATQNMYYNGWAGGTYVNSVFVFAPDGRIRICVINAPGSWHDSNLADYGVYQGMEAIYERTGARVVVDSAFKGTDKKDVQDFMIKSSQEHKVTATQEEIQVNVAATSVRQLSEHGMRMIQGQFPRMKDNMGLEEFGERKVILHLMVLLYNYKTSKIGINTILNTYMSKTKGFKSYAFTCDRTLREVQIDANIAFDDMFKYVEEVAVNCNQ